MAIGRSFLTRNVQSSKRRNPAMSGGPGSIPVMSGGPGSIPPPPTAPRKIPKYSPPNVSGLFKN